MNQAPPASALRTSTRIALIDDTPDLRLLLRVVLESQPGFTVVGEAGDGQGGVDLVEAEQPDLVLLDLAMPIMDGLEALPRILAAAPHCRVVVLSGFEAASMAAAALDAGAHAYLQKGATPDEILTAAADALGSAPAPSPEVARAAPETELEATELERVHAALATAAHELRSPATILGGLSQTLARRRRDLSETAIDQLLEAIVRQAKVLDRVTSDLLTSTQSTRGIIAVDIEPMALSPALEGAALSMSDRTEVTVECPPDVWVRADRVRVDQMLGNLLSNALKYGQPPVQLAAEESGECANVSVVDHGPGVPQELVPRLFGQYARARGLRGGGTGLGLFVVKSLARAQGGDAWYTRPVSGGASFSFSLPLALDGAGR